MRIYVGFNHATCYATGVRHKPVTSSFPGTYPCFGGRTKVNEY